MGALIQKILYATDFSPSAENALDMVAELASREQASITVLTAYDVPYAAMEAGIIQSQLLSDLLAAAQRDVRAVRDRLDARGLTVDTACVQGDPRSVIPRYACDHGFDLVIVGSHGRRGIRRLLLGSVAEHVVRTATVPVLVVHPRAAIGREQPAL